ncbi:MAG: transglycosylase SLT domain-containing protein, partial [Pseudolabrys sp.]
MAVNPAHASAAPQITGAIRQAAQSTGISFEYLLTTAKIESNLNPSAQASTSSAKGLYQFIDQTCLGTMKQDGAALGLGRYVDVSEQLPPPPARRPSFESMFTDRVSQLLAPTVATLWETPPSSGPQNGHAVQV